MHAWAVFMVLCKNQMQIYSDFINADNISQPIYLQHQQKMICFSDYSLISSLEITWTYVFSHIDPTALPVYLSAGSYSIAQVGAHPEAQEADTTEVLQDKETIL